MTILPLFYSNVKKKLDTNVQSSPEVADSGPRPATVEEITSRWRAGQKRYILKVACEPHKILDDKMSEGC